MSAKVLFTWPPEAESDHKNLTYLRTAKRQGSLVTIFCTFSPIVQGPEMSNALSRQFATNTSTAEPGYILPGSCRVGAVTWRIKDTIQQALQEKPNPGTGPPGCQFVPTSTCATVLHWIHTFHFSIHPGMRRTICLLRCHFWWDSVQKDVREYVVACLQ